MLTPNLQIIDASVEGSSFYAVSNFYMNLFADSSLQVHDDGRNATARLREEGKAI